MRREFEDVIADKNEEIKMLRRDLLRMQKNGDSLPRTSPDCDVYIKRTEHETELKRAKEEFDGEKLELERKSDREKAELVQVFTNQTERTNSYFQEERQRIQEDHRKELQFKLEVTERLLSEKFELEKTRMIQQFEREIKELQESLEIGCKEKLLEKEEAIDELEREKRELLNALQIERFSLAQVYSRELSLLTQLDRPTKEDVEVALIDEIAKLKQDHDEALTEMDGQHKQRIEAIKRGQQPIKELENKQRKEIENLKKQFENEKESLEAEFRKEQFNLLKNFEFERNDLEQRYEEMINEKELEIQQKEDDMRNIYEGELDGLKKIVEEQRKELEVSKQKLEDLAGEMEEFASEKNRMEEKFYKENNQCQNLEQNMQNDLQVLEKNMKETKALHHQELVAKMEEFAKEKDELRKNSENEKVNLQREIEILKGRLEEIQKTPEHFIIATSENVLEKDFVEDDAGDIACSYAMGSNEPKTVENKIPVGENQEEEEGQLVGKENDGAFFEKTERKEETRPQRVQQKDVSKGIRKIQERLKECLTDKENEDTLEHLGTSNKRLKEAINQAILELDKLCDDKVECDDVTHIRSQTVVSPFDRLLALDEHLTDEGTGGENDNASNDQVKEKIKAVLNNAHLSHEVEKLHLIERHQEELNELLKELADEKTKRVQETQLALKYLQENDQNRARTLDCVTFKVTEDKGRTTDDLQFRQDKGGYGSMKRPNSENSTHSSSNTAEEVRQEKKEMKRSIEELERHFKSEKSELMEKLQTQHKEFVMSTEGEIIENLLRQKSNLEEAFNLERFCLGRLYYLEMKDELESALNCKTDKMKKDHDLDKMEIILKYEKDIADLQTLLSEKSEMELRLLQDKNDTLRKLLDAQKRSAPERNKAKKRRKDQDRLEREKENLDLTIPLKKELADLQNKRQKEHETAVANLNNAIDLLKEVLSSTQSISEGEEKQNNRQRFLSEDPPRLVVTSPIGKANVRNCKRLLVSDDEICNREELRAALENLIELVLNDEDSLYDSESTSGASSDLESEDSGPTTPIGESDEGAYSGPESTEDDALNIKKSELYFAFNLERFNLSRVYYGEYRDSLKKVMRKLAKAKDSLRNKRNDLENEMLNGIKQLVDKTQFGNPTKQILVTKRNIDTQTFDINDIPSADHDNLSEQGTEGERSLETEKRVDGSLTSRGDNETSELSQRDLKEEEQEDTKRKLDDKRNTPGEKPDEREKQLVNGFEDEKLATGIPQEKINQGDENKREDHLQNNDIQKDDSGEGIGPQPKPIFLEDGKTSNNASDRIGLDPGLGNNLNDKKIVGEQGKEDTLAGGIDEVYTGSGLPAKRPDDGALQ
ncbi:trichohyalin-like [Stylophora pistillata]|uniref:trichohyalin-like n=1 Tax=Stylophora pistillata TaxID=50429 RepID=UPI000C03DACD|nr:trichohyalin-like [Stylophora pistillata]